MEPPSSLPAQLFLLAYDLEHDRMHRSPYLGLSLRAAALTDLLHQGVIADDNGRVLLVTPSGGTSAAHDTARHSPARRSAARRGRGLRGRSPRPASARPGRPPSSVGASFTDPLRARLITEIAASGRERSWRYWVGRRPRGTDRIVRQHLSDGGWIRLEHRRILGIIPTTGVTVRDRVMVLRLQQAVDEALRGTPGRSRSRSPGRAAGAGAGHTADPAPASLAALLAAGQIGALRGRRVRRELRHRLAAVEMVAGPAVPALRAAVRAQQSAAAAG
ncbi:hypothetical protein CcI49_31230 [Frankia sp. CcI49]|uniref:GOLPH3/VPS74 family protein n=1 Tax=Frankia sp. CcI49 TaxID=1745382 RepID=UPI00097888E2|nr:GPP34 family phosphoprotein [Frankia sp. CcI49]ONH54129.1 hypothetical protein CcI49_31230 [Frankia sp. CcI49]